MRKLFTTILLLAVMVVAKALPPGENNPVTATLSEGVVLTLNYDATKGNITSYDDQVKKAIKKGIEAYLIAQGVEPHGPAQQDNYYNNSLKDELSKIVLTGDWANKHLVNGGVIYNMFAAIVGDKGVGLDISACKDFKSIFVSVKDVESGQVVTDITTGIKNNFVDTYFTYNPDPDNPETVEEEVPVLEGSQYSAHLPNNDIDVIINIDELPNPENYTEPIPVTAQAYGSDQDAQLVYADGKWILNMWGQQAEVKSTTNYYYINQDNEKVSVSLDDCNYNDETETYTYTYEYTISEAKFFFDGYSSKITSIDFPQSDKFTFIPDGLFEDGKVTSATLPEGIVAIGNKAFKGTPIATINFPKTLTEMGGAVFEEARSLTSADFSSTSLSRFRYCAFQDATGLQEVLFPTTIKEIQKDAFQRTVALKDVDLSKCHELRLIAQGAFASQELQEGETEGGSVLASVKVCSHPKVIKGGEGGGAFNHCVNIKTVEVVGCKGTNLVQCICENNAFAPEITYVQTDLASIESHGARLIFPQGDEWDTSMAAGAGNLDNDYLGYASSFDYFVGDYKEGVPFKQIQNVLLAYFRLAPRGDNATAVNPTTGETTTVFVPSDNKMAQVYGIGNGWHEFMNVSVGIVIKKDEQFLRTYSRTDGSGAVLLDPALGITAYRAVDYISKKHEYVSNKRGNYVFVPKDTPTKDGLTEEDQYLTKEQCEELEINITGMPTFSYATTEGTLYLRPLRPLKNGQPAAGYSYVPEKTGVVLYSDATSETTFLIFSDYTGTEYDLTKEYPHTGTDRRELTRTETEPDDINLLEGSFGKDTDVAPVFPWIYGANNGKGSYNPDNMVYRNFGFSKSANRWVRLQPGILRYNRAFAMIPIDLFDNHNESTGQMPEFTLNDMPADPNSANTLVMIDNSFEDELDGIENINATKIVVDKDAWYNLQGVKVVSPTKGVYIHNNKKVVIK